LCVVICYYTINLEIKNLDVIKLIEVGRCWTCSRL